jgi:hypothetical protein
MHPGSHVLWQFCLDHLSFIKMAAFQFYLQTGQQSKVGWVGDDSRFVSGQKFRAEKRSVKRSVVANSQFLCH